MKYIRTKEGKIIDLEKRYQEYLNNPNRQQKAKNRLNFYKQCHHNTVKQSDTIEELCDEFVMLRLKDELNDNKPIIFKHLDLAKSYFEKYLGYAIYGAIWTDKGLIYIAKMNNEGELELL